MAWGKVGSKTVATQTNEYTVDDITASDFNFCIASTNVSANQGNSHFRFNGSTGTTNEYAFRTFRDFEYLGDGTTQALIPFAGWSDGTKRYFTFSWIYNKSDKEKLTIGADMSQNTAGSGATANVPHQSHMAGKWVKGTPEAITKITFNDSSSGEISADTTFNMLGSDVTPAAVIPALDNVQDNSLFVEKDTVRRYWFSEAVAPTSEDDLTSDKGWVSNTSDWTYNATGDYLDFATVRRSTTAQQIYIDVQDSDYLGSGNNLSDTAWTARFKIKTGTQGSSSGNIMWYIGFSNNLGDSGTTQQTVAMRTNVNGGASENNLTLDVSRGNFETTGTPARVRADVLSSTNLPYSTDLYMEMTRNGDVFTVKAYTDEYVTQTGVTATATVTGISSLRYIKAFNDSEQQQSYTSSGARLYDMKIYNGVTTVTPATWNVPSKTPAEIGDLKVHYDATVGVTASSNSVSAWADQSGNGKTLSSVSNPTRVEAGQNGKDYIDFNSSKSMRASGLSEDAPRPFSMVIVINPRNTSDQSIIRWGQSPYLALYQYPVNTYYISGGTDLPLTDSTLDDSWNAFFMDFKSDADGGTLQINLDTANAVSGDIGENGTSGSGSNSQPSTLHVGVNGTNNNWYANCRYAEIIMFNKVLTAYEKEQLYGHLKTKWGLP